MTTQIYKFYINWFLAVFTVVIIFSDSANLRAQSYEDPYLWLEEVEGEEPLTWVGKQNKHALDYLTKLEGFQEREQFIYELLTSDEKIVKPLIHNNYVYNFWQSKDFSRGVLRRKELSDYLQNSGSWEILLNVDELSARDSTAWVYKGIDFAGPKSELCLLRLSEGGSDASVLREFNVEEKQFVTNGFYVPAAKSNYAWISSDEILIATDFGEGSLTHSGYPRIVKRWERGSKLSEAEIIFEAENSDMAVSPILFKDSDSLHTFIERQINFYEKELFLFHNEQWIKLQMPKDFNFELLDDELIIHTLNSWEVNGQQIPEGTIVSIPLRDMVNGNFNPKIVLSPSGKETVEQIAVSGSRLLVLMLNNIASELLSFHKADDDWRAGKIELPMNGEIILQDFSRNQPLYAVTFSSFTQPTTLYVGNSSEHEPNEVMQLKSYFNSKNLRVVQHFAVSEDGTKIPYFLVSKAEIDYNGKNPTIIYGYGGFQVSEIPNYNPILGKSWLENGGVYVLTNIRGGGEFGPAWHKAAIKNNKQRSYDDFIAITEDVIAKKISSPQHIGIQGGSNGGLLVGAVMVQRPDLFSAVVCMVPLLDMKRYSRLLAGASWMAEYGNPDIPEEWEYIRKYSPYQNVREGEYPSVLFMTSTRDDRVHPGHARKMAAKMKDLGHEVFLFENTEGGHGASYTPQEKATFSALYYSFFIDQLGLNSDR